MNTHPARIHAMHKLTTSMILSVAFLTGCPACPKGGDDPESAGPDPKAETTGAMGSTSNHINPVPGGCLTTSGPECHPETTTAAATTAAGTTTGTDATTTGAAPSVPSDPAPTPIPQ